MKITGTNKDSVCIYCNQTTYGPGCPFSPSKIHIHADDPKRCIYCGQKTHGPGCPFNPTGKVHVFGIDFNNAVRENIQKTLTTQLFLTRLTQPIIETPAYKLGLIDESGRRIKLPNTEEEKQAYTPLDSLIFRLRRTVSESQLKLLNSSLVLETLNRNPPVKYNLEIHEKEKILRGRIESLILEYQEVISDAAKDGFTLDQVENLFVESIFSD